MAETRSAVVRFLHAPSPRLRLALALASLLFLKLAQASPQVLRVDGSLYDNAGLPVSGQRDLQIKAYNAATSGTLLWTSPVGVVNVAAGRFSFALDASSGSPSLVQRLAESSASGAVWFEIHYDSGTAGNGSMNTDLTVLPRIRARGAIFALSTASADSLKGVSSSTAELNYLMGVTNGVQTQLNAKGDSSALTAVSNAVMGATGSVTAKLNRTGDTMAGELGLHTSVTPSRFLMIDSARKIVHSSNAVTDTEFGYLLGLTSSIASRLNGVTVSLIPIGNALQSVTGTALGGYLMGLTNGVQTQLNAKGDSSALTAVSNAVMGVTGNVAAKLNRSGDTLSGDLGLHTSVTPSRFLMIDSARKIVHSSNTVTDTEFGYLLGLTSSISSRLNGVTVSLAPIGNALQSVTGTALGGYLMGLTNNVQTQLNAKATGTNYVAKGGDTMTGTLRVNSGQFATSQNIVLGATVDFNSGNVQILQSPGTNTIILNNMQDGAAYTLIITDTTPREYSFTNCTNSWFVPSSAATANKTVYSILKVTLSAATHCYISWITGF